MESKKTRNRAKLSQTDAHGELRVRVLCAQVQAAITRAHGIYNFALQIYQPRTANEKCINQQ